MIFFSLQGGGGVQQITAKCTSHKSQITANHSHKYTHTPDYFLAQATGRYFPKDRNYMPVRTISTIPYRKHPHGENPTMTMTMVFVGIGGHNLKLKAKQMLV
jgi:hypothetical protein